MAGRRLTDDEIADVITYYHNTQQRLESRITPAFDKVATLSIIDAVTDRLTLTRDKKFRIGYYHKSGHESDLFYVRPVGQLIPCGNFEVDTVVARLAL